MLDPLVQEPADQERRRQSDRRVDEEDPAPADRCRDDAADRRPHHSARPPDTGEEPLDLGPLLALEDVADDRERDRLDRSGAQALDRPEEDELRHRTGEATQHRTADE